MYTSGALITFTMLYNHLQCLQNFSTARKETLCPVTPPPSLPPAPDNLYHTVFMNLPVLGISHNWNFATFVLLCLTFHSTQCFPDLSSCSTCQPASFSGLNNILLYGWTAFCLSIYRWWAVGCSTFWQLWIKTSTYKSQFELLFSDHLSIF